MDKSFVREIKKIDKDMNVKKSCQIILDKVAHEKKDPKKDK